MTAGWQMVRQFVILFVVVVVVVGGSAFFGQRVIGVGEVLAGDEIFWQLRVPRSLLAAVAGAGLAVGGVVFQALFRNPLATPYTLGVASGASLAAAMGFLSGWGGMTAAGVPVLSVLAFGGALGTMLLVYLVSHLRAGRDMMRLLLAGVCVAYMCSAGILLITYLADRAVTNDIVIWMMGSLGVVRWQAPLEIAVILVPVVGLAALQHRALDLLSFGQVLAGSRGVRVGLTVWSCYGLVGLLVAVIVANCGPIGFVGLMVPHIGRAIFGVRTLPVLVGAGLLGAAFLAVCDGIARSIPVTELPVGVVTNILGAGFFFYLLATRDVAHAAVRDG